MAYAAACASAIATADFANLQSNHHHLPRINGNRKKKKKGKRRNGTRRRRAEREKRKESGKSRICSVSTHLIAVLLSSQMSVWKDEIQRATTDQLLRVEFFYGANRSREVINRKKKQKKKQEKRKRK